jgi:release factor glutamine methyltransferase
MQTQQQLKIVTQTAKKLSELDHPDALRVAKEITGEYGYKEELIDEAVERIAEGEPWEYIRGYTEFRGEKFIVTPNVLIPRIETEQLVDIALELIKRHNPEQVIDVGTGSGAIICSIAKNLGAKVKLIATDVSGDALTTAKANAKLLGIENINFKQADLLEGIDLSYSTVIIANLPYVKSGDYRDLPDSVREFEPKTALVGGKDGAFLIKKILQQMLPLQENIPAIALELDPDMVGDLEKFVSVNLPAYTLKVLKDFRDQERFTVIEK